jgi:retinol dehydrogenase-12
VTGSNTGVGKEVAQLLYSKNAKVYVGARSEEKARAAIERIRTEVPGSKGTLVFLHLDLGDLATIKASASSFLAQESKLHVLFNNAGVMVPPQGSKTAQGYELQLGTNCLGHFLFTQLLTPVLLETAKAEPAGAVRVVWVSSSAAEFYTDRHDGGLFLDNLDYHADKSPQYKYGVSKVGNYYHATEYMRRYGPQGILSVGLNPGNLRSDLQRTVTWNGLQKALMNQLLLHEPHFGAYTELFAGLSPDVSAEALKKCNWSTLVLPSLSDPSPPLQLR